MIETGIYAHYKGGLCLVTATAKHTETGEELVIYSDMSNTSYARPASMFLENVKLDDGRTTPRFVLLRGVVYHGMSAYDLIVDGLTTKPPEVKKSWWERLWK